MRNLEKYIVFGLALVLTACLPEVEKEEVSVSTSGTGAVDPGFQTLPDGPTPPTDDQSSSCTDTGTCDAGSSPPPMVGEPAGVEGLAINDGAAATAETILHLALYKEEALQMKISANATCEGGTWVTYSEESDLTMVPDMFNKTVSVSARFSDYDGRRSKCFTASILHDNVGPEIIFQKYPTVAVQENTAVELIYSAQDFGVGVDRVSCSLNGFSQSCTAGRTIVNIPGAAPGSYTFTVVAKDKQGIENQASVTWSVTAVGRLVTHSLQVAEYRKWDILIVDDNSGSMSYEQTSMGSRTRNFLSILRGLDWQIAVTTTDPRAPFFDKHGQLVKYVGGDGDFIELKGAANQYILKPTMYDEATAQNVLSQTLQRSEVGSGSEQGIRATYRVIEKALTAAQTPPTIQSQFLRAGANLAVVLISDEDESANTTKNDPQSLLNLIKTSFNEQKNFIFNSIITVPGEKTCLDGEGATYGERYKTITQMTGGLMGSVCAMDYASQMTGIAENIRSMAKSFTLNCLPMAERGVTVTHNGAAFNMPFTLDGLKLTFNDAIEPGAYQLKYFCLN